MTSETLKRYAAAVPVFVEAGCPECKNIIEDDDGYICLPRVIDIPILDTYGKDPQYNDLAVIAVLEQWFAQTVVPWARKTYCSVQIPDENEGLWVWGVETNGRWVGENDSSDPTEAYIQCAEALAEVIGANR